MSNDCLFKCCDRSVVPVWSGLFDIEQGRRPESIALLWVERRIEAPIVDPETIGAEPKLREGHDVEFEIREIRTQMARYTPPFAIEQDPATELVLRQAFASAHEPFENRRPDPEF